jgi:membrane protease YdiL (CAAX protease family)
MDVAPAGRAARSPGRLAAWIAFVGLLSALNYAGRFAVEDGTGDRDLLYEWTTFVGGLIQFGIMLVIVLRLAAGGPASVLLALGAPRSWGKAVGMILGVFVATLVLAAALDPIFHAGEEQGLAPDGWDASRAGPFVANFVIVAGLVPVVEELTFRGAGFAFLERFGQGVAIVGTAVAFGLAHGLVAGLPILVAFGLGLGWLRARSESTLPCIALHSLFNTVALLAAVTLGADSP